MDPIVAALAMEAIKCLRGKRWTKRREECAVLRVIRNGIYRFGGDMFYDWGAVYLIVLRVVRNNNPACSFYYRLSHLSDEELVKN